MKNRSLQQVLQSRVVITIEVILVIVLVVAITREALRRHEVDAEVSRLEQQIGKLENQNVQLAQVLKEMTSDNYLEKEARKKLDLQKSGETVVLLPQNGSTEDSTSSGGLSRNAQINVNDSNATRWWQYFFSQQS